MVVVCGLLAVVNWLLIVACCRLVVACCMLLVVRCVLLVLCWLVVGCSVLVVVWCLRVASCWLFVVRWCRVSFVVRGALFVGWCRLCVDYCMLFVVCCGLLTNSVFVVG